VKLREILKNNPLLSSLTATQQTRLHGLIRPCSHPFHPGEVIVDKDSAAGFAYLVAEGSVDVCRDRVLIDTLKRGGLFGVKEVFEGKSSKTFSFVAKEETCLYRIEHDDLKRFLDTNPGVYIKMYHLPY